ncbi:ATP-binding protein [Rhizobacter sp. SG703]|uniref:AAA family ATPase n=1 Tax=Rhizobacter sp. SG703 TaxID=2587140 RepID=UPI001444BDAF|nr:ATP-binding protein [Rhizobacter sp. SG703]NKI92693.1 nicotinamide riboside kinase [Rhizobacter sp. SG703]
MSRIIAIVGAESTGKTTLAGELQASLQRDGHSVALVGEYLREFCDRHARTPRVDEQAAIAREQSQRIARAAEANDIVIADTTALMIAVYSEQVFGDRSLYDSAIEAQRGCTLTLLTALDIPWQADGLQRDGPQVREPVTALVRAALGRGGIGYSVVAGTGPSRLSHALLAVRHALLAPSLLDEARANPRWQWVCERCGDAECERHLLP